MSHVRNAGEYHHEIRIFNQTKLDRIWSVELIPSLDEKAIQLKKLKELLDSGVITREEFDELKKEILEKGFTPSWPKIKLPKITRTEELNQAKKHPSQVFPFRIG